MPEISSAKLIKYSSTHQKYIDEYVNRAQKAVKNPNITFSCQGIGVQDNGSALDRDVYYFYLKTNKLISISSMTCISAATRTYVNHKLFCPPPELKTDFCIAKYKEKQFIDCLNHREWYKKYYNKVLSSCSKP